MVAKIKMSKKQHNEICNAICELQVANRERTAAANDPESILEKLIKAQDAMDHAKSRLLNIGVDYEGWLFQD